MEEMNVVKKGETCANIRIRRSVGGLNLTVFGHTELEALFRSWGDGSTVDVRGYVRGGWNPVVPLGHNPVENPLLVYNMKSSAHILFGDADQSYTLDAPGQPLLLPDPRSGRPDGCLNMSFLRLVGISEGAGVGFTVKGVWTLEAIRMMRNDMQNVVRRFYNSYLRPIDTSLSIFTSVQEVPGSGWVGGVTQI